MRYLPWSSRRGVRAWVQDARSRVVCGCERIENIELSKDETNIDLRGLKRHYWNGTEAGCLGCYDFSGETWAGDGSHLACIVGVREGVIAPFWPFEN